MTDTFDVTVDPREFSRAPPAHQRKLRTLARQLQTRPFLGEKIRAELIPPRFRTLPNLHRLALSDGWRALYTVATHPTEGREVRIVFIGDHKRYDRLFGYQSS
ncbi:MAG: hypothetical protein WDA16_01190 [Candidatus Thermoplasmatota archaeon]